jgi:Cache domain
MKMRVKYLLPLVAVVSALGFGSAASAAGTADGAKALLAKAVAALKADKGALAKFDDPKGGFIDDDLYVFCFDRKTGIAENGSLKGKDMRTIKDSSGKAFGQAMFDAKEGETTTVEYMFPKPGKTDPSAKVSLIQVVGDLDCGVGYYK